MDLLASLSNEAGVLVIVSVPPAGLHDDTLLVTTESGSAVSVVDVKF